MYTEKLEPLKSKIVFKMNSDILHVHNRQHFNDLNIGKETFDNTQLLRLNNEIFINNNKYKITEVYFKLEENMLEIRNSNNAEKEDSMSHNSQVVVLVQPLF